MKEKEKERTQYSEPYYPMLGHIIIVYAYNLSLLSYTTKYD